MTLPIYRFKSKNGYILKVANSQQMKMIITCVLMVITTLMELVVGLNVLSLALKKD